MSRENFTDVTMILDRSGSMLSIKNATIKGFNDYVAEQRTVPGDGCWSLIQFDDQYEVVYAGAPQGDVPLLTCDTFQLRGSTALIDAICKTIVATNKRLDALPEDQKPSKVLFVIMTDGMENASIQYTKKDLNDMIAHQRDGCGWGFIFLGANQDAIATAASYGIDRGMAMTYQPTSVGVEAAFRASSTGTRNWKLDGNKSAENLLIDPADQQIQVNVTVNKTT